jgi:hypothetical protein
VTLYGQLAMMGLQVDLDIPTIGLVSEQPPLRGDDMQAALVDYSEDLLPGGSSQPAALAEHCYHLDQAVRSARNPQPFATTSPDG